MINFLKKTFYIEKNFNIYEAIYVFFTILYSIIFLSIFKKDWILFFHGICLLFFILGIIYKFQNFNIRKIFLISMIFLVFIFLRLSLWDFLNTTNLSKIQGKFNIISINKEKKITKLNVKKGWTNIEINSITKDEYLEKINNISTFYGSVRIFQNQSSKKEKIYYGSIISIDKTLEKSYFEKIKEKLKLRVKKIFSQNYGLVLGLIFGDKSWKEQYKSINDLGLQHITAVSGLHMSAIYESLFYFIRVVFIYWTGISFFLAYFISLISLFFMLFLADFSPSATRSFLMHLSRLLSLIFNLKYNKFLYWSIIYFLMVSYNPQYLENPSFLLSFYGVLGLYFSLLYVPTLLKQIIISLFILPFTLCIFGELNTLSIFWNIIFIEIFSKIIIFSFLGLIFESVGKLLDKLLSNLILLTEYFANYKFSLIVKLPRKKNIKRSLIWIMIFFITFFMFFIPINYLFILYFFILLAIFFISKKLNIVFNL